ncbi:hypothetical protein GCM10010377_69290 [Streptomyces viridiviolaceus]|uniref:Uncharacterized protein n=1 Tax=Streptomyces viridiviolaceus TaxID=68282 RepID=A0ABW2DZW0_9ACTN|nr:hypothetical protein [Streptomyces viridiviolaceus]GHB68571.1 hypothetical protein GCM10010377_69290 [Streptomyces viridiviolaceus]
MADALGEDGHDDATVAVAAGLEHSRDLWKRLSAVLDDCRRSGVAAVRLVWADAGADLPGRPAVARRIRDDWDLEVIAPAGPVVVAPGGTLFAPQVPERRHSPGGWWLFTPGLTPRPLGLRYPVPSWEDAAARLDADAVAGFVVEPVPAGVWIRGPGRLAESARAVGASLPVDGQRLAVVVGASGTPPVTAQALAELLSLLPPRARAAVRLLPGDGGDVLDIAQQAADLLGAEMEVLSGVPVLLESVDDRGSGESAVVLLGADGEPSWRPYVEAVACVPAHSGSVPAPRIVSWRPPAPGLTTEEESGVFSLDGTWQVAVTRAGLWVGSRGDRRPERTGRPLDPDRMWIDVGLPGQSLDDRFWSVLDTLLEELEPSVHGRTAVHLLGNCTVEGRRRLRQVTERRGLSLSYDEQASVIAEDPQAGAGEAAEPRPERSPAAGGDGAAQAPWHAEPMSVRIRHVPTTSPPVAQQSPATAPVNPAVSGSRKSDEARTPRPAMGTAPLPPGFAEAFAASRSVGVPRGRSVPVSWQTARTAPQEQNRTAAAPAEAPAAHGLPAPSSAPSSSASVRTAAAPVPPTPPSPTSAVTPVPARSPVTTTAAPSAAPVPPTAGVGTPVRITPSRRSGQADRQAVQAMAGDHWWQQQATVARLLTVMPGLRTQAQDQDAQADLIAVRCLLTLDEVPLSWTWLVQQLAAGSADALSYLACLASGLRRLPSYRGIVVRDAGVVPPTAAAPPTGTELCEPLPVGAFALNGAPPIGADRYVIWSVTGRRVANLLAPSPGAEGEEILFAPGTRFKVLATRGSPGAMTVLLRELADGDPTAQPGGLDAQDRGALEHLAQAADRVPRTAGAMPWPPRLTGRLAERHPRAGDGA